MECSEIFTGEPCPECNGDGMASFAVLDMNNDVYVPLAANAKDSERRWTPKKYDNCMDEYNYRAGLD